MFKYLVDNPDDIAILVTWMGTDGKEHGYRNEKYKTGLQKSIEELKKDRASKKK